MTPRHTCSALLLAAMALPLVACAYGHRTQVIRAQFASEIDCDYVEVWERELQYYEHNEYRVKAKGCGEVRTYTCPEPDGLTEYGDTSCTWEQGDTDIPVFGADAQKRIDERDDMLGDTPDGE